MCQNYERSLAVDKVIAAIKGLLFRPLALCIFLYTLGAYTVYCSLGVKCSYTCLNWKKWRAGCNSNVLLLAVNMSIVGKHKMVDLVYRHTGWAKLNEATVHFCL